MDARFTDAAAYDRDLTGPDVAGDRSPVTISAGCIGTRDFLRRSTLVCGIREDDCLDHGGSAAGLYGLACTALRRPRAGCFFFNGGGHRVTLPSPPTNRSSG